MGQGNSFRLEGGPERISEPVYVDVPTAVIDRYNAALMQHLNDHMPQRSYRYWDDVKPFESSPSAEVDGSYPKLVGNKVLMLPFDGNGGGQ